jgi:hypothetical protein
MFPSSGEKLRNTYSVWSLRKNTRQWTKSRIPVIVTVIYYHHLNPLESRLWIILASLQGVKASVKSDLNSIKSLKIPLGRIYLLNVNLIVNFITNKRSNSNSFHNGFCATTTQILRPNTRYKIQFCMAPFLCLLDINLQTVIH